MKTRLAITGSNDPMEYTVTENAILWNGHSYVFDSIVDKFEMQKLPMLVVSSIHADIDTLLLQISSSLENANYSCKFLSFGPNTLNLFDNKPIIESPAPTSFKSFSLLKEKLHSITVPTSTHYLLELNASRLLWDDRAKHQHKKTMKLTFLFMNMDVLGLDIHFDSFGSFFKGNFDAGLIHSILRDSIEKERLIIIIQSVESPNLFLQSARRTNRFVFKIYEHYYVRHESHYIFRPCK
jgi:hypothetical protein